MSIGMPARPAWAIFLLIAAFVVVGACSRGESSKSSPSTVALFNDPVQLDNALARCNQRSASVEDPECRNVRLALVRLAAERRQKDGDAERLKQQSAERKFEREREALRQRLEREREQSKQPESIDPYTMPFIPPESPGAPKTDATTPPASQLSQSETAATPEIEASGPG